MESDLIKNLKHILAEKNGPAIYARLEECLETLILKGTLAEGTRIPSEVSLGAQLGINHQTIRKALVRLAKKGYLDRRQKSGTFVCGLRKNLNIGLFYHQEAADDYMNEAALYLQQACSEHHLDLKQFAYDDSYFLSGNFSTDLQKMNLDGVIVGMEHTDACRNAVLEMIRKKMPLVSFNNCFPLPAEIPQVRCDIAARMTHILEGLWEKGHRRIGCIADFRNSEGSEAYFRFCEEKKMNSDGRFISMEFNGPYQHYLKLPMDQIMLGYLTANPDLSAVVIQGVEALSLIRQLNVLQKRVPEDLSVVCLIDNLLCLAAQPPLSAAKLDYRELAGQTVEKLLVLMDGKPLKEKITLVPEQFISRKSVKSCLP